MSRTNTDLVKVPRTVLEQITKTLCYAA
jgi:hypothetical protein